MPNIKLTKDKIRHHWSYHKSMYIIMVIAVAFSWSLIYSVTEYRPPNEKKIDTFLIGEYANSDKLAEVALLAAPDFPNVELIEFNTIQVGGDNDVYGQQKLQVMLGAGEGDIYICGRELFYQLLDMGGLIPLDNYIQTGVINPGDIDLSGVTLTGPYNEETGESEGEHVYGLPLENQFGLFEQLSFDNRGKVIVLMGYSKNQDDCAGMINWLYHHFEAPAPDWLENYDKNKAAGK